MRVILIFLLWTFCHTVQAEAAKKVTGAESVIETTEQLEARILEVLAENNAPGMIGAIVSGDEVVCKRFGACQTIDHHCLTFISPK